MPLTLDDATAMASVAALNTERLPQRMDQRCLVIARAVQAGMPPTVPAVNATFIAMRWYAAIGTPRSHVAVRLDDGAVAYVVDASWQQYPFVDKFIKYHGSRKAKHQGQAGVARATNKALQQGERVFVGTADDWQSLVLRYNVVQGALSRRVFADADSAGDWMAFRV